MLNQFIILHIFTSGSPLWPDMLLSDHSGLGNKRYLQPGERGLQSSQRVSKEGKQSNT